MTVTDSIRRSVKDALAKIRAATIETMAGLQLLVDAEGNPLGEQKATVQRMLADYADCSTLAEMEPDGTYARAKAVLRATEPPSDPSSAPTMMHAPITPPAGGW